MPRFLCIILCFCSFHTFSQTAYPTGLSGCIARWNFTNSGTISSLPDVSGNGNNGSAANLVTATAFRLIPNKAIKFNGTNSYSQVAHASILTPPQMTIIALVNFDGFFSGTCQESQIISKGYPYAVPGNWGMGVGDNTYDKSCSIYSPNYMQQTNQFNSASQTLSAGNYVQTGKWYFMATTYEGNTVKYYQKEMDTNTYYSIVTPIFTQSGLSTSIGSNSQDVTIGKHLNPSFLYWFNGRMDEITLFNRVLNDSEIQNVYHYLWGGISVTTSDNNICGSKPFTVNYTILNPDHFYGSNTFTVQLSDAAGSFSAPSVIGSVTATTSGSIACSIPVGTPYGTGYRVRILASNSHFISGDNGTNITYGPPPFTVNLGKDTSFCDGDSIILTATAAAPVSYLWNTGATTASIQVKTPGIYSIIATANFCSNADTVLVTRRPNPDVYLGNDTFICINTVAVLRNYQHNAGYSYLWNTGSTANTQTASNTGIYWLRAENNGCYNTDTVSVTIVNPPVVNLGEDRHICKGDTVVFMNWASNPLHGHYQWNTGDTSFSLTARNEGQYKLTITELGCSGSDSANIIFKPTPDVFIGNDTLLCDNDSIVLHSNSQKPGSTYKWSTGSTSDHTTISAKGNYTLNVTYDGCTGSDDLTVNNIPLPYITLGDDPYICNGDTLGLPKDIVPGYQPQFLWSDGSTGAHYTIRKEGTYWVRLTNICGSTQDTVTASYHNCSLWFPSAFSPNGDGKNDLAKLFGDLSGVSSYHLKIFNRWGQAVFTTEDINAGWDGHYKGKPVEFGTYYYLIKANYRGKDEILKGDITLIW